MRCKAVQNVLVSYLDGEITPTEHVLLQQHLRQCADCQRQLAMLDETRSRIKYVLHDQADQAHPSPSAWDHLQARLAHEVRPQASIWARWKPTIPPFLRRHQFGGITMYKGVFITVLTVMVAALMIGYLSYDAPPPVSAEDILDRAYVARQAVLQQAGIYHTRTETYRNHAIMSDTQILTESTTLTESYIDYQSNLSRSVITDKATDTLVAVSAYDGTYFYTSVGVENAASSEQFTIYRSYQPPGVMTQFGIAPGIPASLDAEYVFEALQGEMGMELVGQEPWLDGRMAYVLRSTGIFMFRGQPEEDAGVNTLYFDAETYRLLENRTTFIQDEQELLVGYERYWVDEVLPVDTSVTWDLSDLDGVVFVDEVDDSAANLSLPIPVSLAELLDLIPVVYVLDTVPEGFEMEISVGALEGQTAYYRVAYHNQAGSYLILESMGHEFDSVPEEPHETYTTANGLALYLIRDDVPPDSAHEFTLAVIQTPDGVNFILSSNLPYAEIKALAEELVLADGTTP